MNLIKKILPLVLAVGLLCGSCISVSAAEPDFDLSQFELKEYTLVADMMFSMNSYGCYVITSDSPITVEGLRVIVKGPFNIYYRDDKYGFTENVSSYILETSASGVRWLNCSTLSILFADHDILDQNGNIFFQAPVMPLATKAEVLPGTIRNQTEVILPIAVCGLALLMGLTVLSKKLPIFLH